MLAQQRQQFTEAEQWYRKSLAIEDKLKDEYGRALTLNQMGMIAEAKSKFNEAEKLYLEAEKVFKKYRDEYLLSKVHLSLKQLRNKKRKKYII